MARTADIYLTPRELDARADEMASSACKMPPGAAKDRVIQDVLQDRRMADLKRMAGDPDDRPGA